MLSIVRLICRNPALLGVGLAASIAIPLATPVAAATAQRVNVTLTDTDGDHMVMQIDKTQVQTGPITFVVNNVSKDQIHEMLVVKTDGAAALPYDNTQEKVIEEKTQGPWRGIRSGSREKRDAYPGSGARQLSPAVQRTRSLQARHEGEPLRIRLICGLAMPPNGGIAYDLGRLSRKSTTAICQITWRVDTMGYRCRRSVQRPFFAGDYSSAAKADPIEWHRQ